MGIYHSTSQSQSIISGGGGGFWWWCYCRSEGSLILSQRAVMLGSGMNMVTTVIGFGMSATFIIFIFARLICARIRPPGSSTTAFDIELRSDIGQPEHNINGLEPVVVATIPTLKFNRDAFRSIEDAQCSICLGEYEEKEMLRILPTCGHNFHLTCIDVWLEKQSTCPICRLSLHDLFEGKYVPSPLLGRALQMVDSPEVASYHPNQSLLSSHERSGNHETNQEIRDSVFVNLELSCGEEPGARR